MQHNYSQLLCGEKKEEQEKRRKLLSFFFSFQSSLTANNKMKIDEPGFQFYQITSPAAVCQGMRCGSCNSLTLCVSVSSVFYLFTRADLFVKTRNGICVCVCLRVSVWGL